MVNCGVGNFGSGVCPFLLLSSSPHLLVRCPHQCPHCLLLTPPSKMPRGGEWGLTANPDRIPGTGHAQVGSPHFLATPQGWQPSLDKLSLNIPTCQLDPRGTLPPRGVFDASSIEANSAYSLYERELATQVIKCAEVSALH